MFIEVVTHPGADDMAIVERGQRDFERSKSPGLTNGSEDIPLGALAKLADSTIVGGIKANIYWKRLEIETLWIAEEQRGQGYEVYGELDDRPAGPVLYHMKKRL